MDLTYTTIQTKHKIRVNCIYSIKSKEEIQKERNLVKSIAKIKHSFDMKHLCREKTNIANLYLDSNNQYNIKTEINRSLNTTMVC